MILRDVAASHETAKHEHDNEQHMKTYGRFPKFHRVFLGRDSGTLKSDIVSTKTSTINLFGFETLKLKIRRLKLWKPTVVAAARQLFDKIFGSS